MPNHSQNWAEQRLPGASKRLDYSNRQMRRSMPTTLAEFDELMHEANTQGPSSPAYGDYMKILQSGLAREDFPDTEGGGLPRSIEDTQRAMGERAVRQHYAFKMQQVDPLLLQLKDTNGTPLAALGPDRAREVVALQMLEAPPSQRAQLVNVMRAIDNSPATNQGITIETSPSDLQVLQIESAMEDVGGNDPTGYQQFREGLTSPSEGIEGLMIHTSSDPALAGIDMSSIGSGGGTYYADLDPAWQSNNGGGGDFNQGDEPNVFD